jgi:N-acetylglucosaminyl-diphospho-decaprenol L-rhamnosyltransferase
VRVEVCVVAYDSGSTLPALVRSLHHLGPGIGLAVHDNGPGAASLPVAAAAAAEIGLPFRAEPCRRGNCGFAAGCNDLARGSEADDVLFLNPDAVVLAWRAGLSARGRIVGARVLDPSGREAASYGTSRTLVDEVRLRWLRRAPHEPDGHGYVSGAAILVDRGTFSALGGFDEGFFMYYEDIDLCHRAGDAGISVVRDPGFVVTHVGGHSVGKTTAGLTAAHLRSYRSGRRYHAKRGRSGRAYDALCLVDAAARSALRAPLASSRPWALADWAVAREAARSLVGRSRGDDVR